MGSIFSISRLLLFESRHLKVMCVVSRASGDEYMFFELVFQTLSLGNEVKLIFRRLRHLRAVPSQPPHGGSARHHPRAVKLKRRRRK